VIEERKKEDSDLKEKGLAAIKRNDWLAFQNIAKQFFSIDSSKLA